MKKHRSQRSVAKPTSSEQPLIFTEKELANLKARRNTLSSSLRADATQDREKLDDGSHYNESAYRTIGTEWQLGKVCAEVMRATIAATPTSNEVVAIRTTVKIRRDRKVEIWTIVGHGGSNPDEGLIAYDTALGEFLMGKALGFKGNCTICGTTTKITILDISITPPTRRNKSKTE